jgi:hypothetical protein
LNAEGVQHVTDARADATVEFLRLGAHSSNFVTGTPRALATPQRAARDSMVCEKACTC